MSGPRSSSQQIMDLAVFGRGVGWQGGQNFRQWKGVILVQNTNFSPSWPVTPPQSLSKSAFLFDVNLDIFETM